MKGKKAEPSREELEFIYSRLHLSDGEILEEMQDTTFPLRSPGFIKHRRKEFAAARAVLEELVKKEFDAVLAQRKKDHWANLSEVAGALSSNFSKIRNSSNDAEVLGDVIDGGSIWLHGEPAPVHFSGSVRDDPRRLEKVDGYLAQRLLKHVEEKFPSTFGKVKDWRELGKEDISEEFVEKLSHIAYSRDFHGTACDICKDWE